MATSANLTPTSTLSPVLLTDRELLANHLKDVAGVAPSEPSVENQHEAAEFILKKFKAQLVKLKNETTLGNSDYQKANQLKLMILTNLAYSGVSDAEVNIRRSSDNRIEFSVTTVDRFGRRNTQQSSPDKGRKTRYSYNIVQTDLRAISAVIGTRSPRGKVQPIDTASSDSYSTTSLPDRILQFHVRSSNMDYQNAKAVGILGLSGPAYTFTRFVVDADKYGVSDQGKACGSVEVSIHGPDAVTLAPGASTVDDTPWAALQTFEHKANIVKAHPQFRDKAQSGESVSSSMGARQGSLLRREMLQYYNFGNDRFTQRDQWLYTRLFIRPEMYAIMPDDKDGKLHDVLRQYFPAGCQLCYVEDEPVNILPVVLTDALAMATPDPLEGSNARPYMSSYIDLTSMINDLLYYVMRAAKASFATTVISNEILPKQYADQDTMEPGKILITKSGKSELGRFQTSIAGARFPGPIVSLIPQIIQMWRENSGALPPIFGGGESKTAREAELKKNQALMRLYMLWKSLIEMWAATYRNVIRSYARNTSGGGYLYSVNGRSEQIDAEEIENLFAGGWSIEVSDAFPMSPQQLQSWYTTMLTTLGAHQVIGPKLGVDSPENLDVLQQSLGQSEWRIPELDELGAINDHLQAFLYADETTAILPPQIMYNMGFDPQLVLRATKAFVMSAKGRSLQSNPSPEAEQLRMRLVQWVQEWQAIMAPPPPEGPGGPNGPGPSDGPGDAPPLQDPAMPSAAVGGLMNPQLPVEGQPEGVHPLQM